MHGEFNLARALRIFYIPVTELIIETEDIFTSQ